MWGMLNLNMIGKDKIRIQLTIQKETNESIDMIVEAFKNKGAKDLTKSKLIESIYIEWLTYQHNEIIKATKEEK